MTTGKAIALTIWTFVSRVMSLLFNTLSRFVIAFLPRSNCLLISWLQSLSSDFGAQEEEICHYFHLSAFYLPFSNGAGCHDFSFLIFSLKPALGSVQLISHVRLFVTPWTAAHQAALSIANSWSLLRLMSIELVMPSNHLILCHPLPSIFSSIKVFSNE